ncbi:hypothetical protein J6590_011559, partial [Homalodisca vitripennis]
MSKKHKKGTGTRLIHPSKCEGRDDIWELQGVNTLTQGCHTCHYHSWYPRSFLLPGKEAIETLVTFIIQMLSSDAVTDLTPGIWNPGLSLELQKDARVLFELRHRK